MKRVLLILTLLCLPCATVRAQTPSAVTGALSVANCPAGCVLLNATGWGSGASIVR
jgi:hypothetical protein